MAKPPVYDTRESILIVDDTPPNLRLLSQMLSAQGYKVRPVIDGERALVAARSTPPDLILLDIMMPGMDGYEVCAHLKSDPLTRDVPVIFISALDVVRDKVRAFIAGGVDYITKPFQSEEVVARVRTHLALRRLQRDLQSQVLELDAFAHTVAHDLKNPLALLVGYAEFLRDNVELSEEERQEYLNTVVQVGWKLSNIVDELLLLASVRDKQDVKLEVLDMAQIIANAQQRLLPMSMEYQPEIVLPERFPKAWGYSAWVEEVWVNYLSNALKYGGRPPQIELGATPDEDGYVRFWIRDNGAGLTSEQQAQLFMPFERLHNVHVEGHGLGLSIVRRIVERLGGQVGVESEVGVGSEFYFTLPAVSET